MSKTEEINRLKKSYAEELKRKDKIIEELREQNTIIMKSALKQSEKIEEITNRLDGVLKKQKK